jgi:MFS superfamily sulfate permease-like transporter
LETLLSVEAIDKLDPYNRITPQNRELVAQGIGNFMSGFVGGIPITAVIVRSSANAEAGAKTRLSAFSHGIWLLLVVLLAVPVVNLIPYCVLAVLLIRTGYNLAKPSMIKAVYKQGNEQFYPFIVTVIAILFTDLLIGVIIGVVHALFYLVKHTYRAGFTWQEINEGHHKHIKIELALNVSFLNKKKLRDALDKIPAYSVVELSGGDSVYIDNDVLEIIHDFKHKARQKHISLTLSGVPDVITLALDDHH